MIFFSLLSADDMDRRTLLQRGTFLFAVAAVLLALFVFKVRIAVAGGKYVIALAVILGVVWLISRGLRR